MRKQCLSRQAAGNDVISCAALMHAIRATAARVTWANGHAHAELRWHHIQPFRAILANAMHLPPAAGAALISQVQHMLHTLKMRGQSAAIALTRLCCTRCCCGLRHAMASKALAKADFAEVRLSAPPPKPSAPSQIPTTGMMEITLPGGALIRVDAAVDGVALGRVLAALAGR